MPLIFEVIGFINKYLGSEIPKQVNKRIEAGLEVVQEDMEKALKKSLLLGFFFDALLMTASISSTFFLLEGLYKSYEKLWLGVLIASPCVMIIRYSLYLVFRMRDMSYLEHGITAVIKEAAEGSEMSKKLLVTFYESRSTEELARAALGAFVLDSFEIIKKKWVFAVFSSITFLIVYACMVWVLLTRIS